MRTVLFITIVVVSSLLSFLFLLNYQSFNEYYDYVYAFKPSNAPAANETTSNISKQQQQQQSIENTVSSNKKMDETYSFINSWGSEGTADGQFGIVGGIAVDPSSGDVYISDYINHRIQKFDSNGNFIAKRGSEGYGDGEFYQLFDIEIDSSTGNVYVAYSTHKSLTAMVIL